MCNRYGYGKFVQLIWMWCDTWNHMMERCDYDTCGKTSNCCIWETMIDTCMTWGSCIIWQTVKRKMKRCNTNVLNSKFYMYKHWFLWIFILIQCIIDLWVTLIYVLLYEIWASDMNMRNLWHWYGYVKYVQLIWMWYDTWNHMMEKCWLCYMWKYMQLLSMRQDDWYMHDMRCHIPVPNPHYYSYMHAMYYS